MRLARKALLKTSDELATDARAYATDARGRALTQLKTSDELAREAEEGAEARELSHPSRMLEAHTSRMLVDVWPASDEGLV